MELENQKNMVERCYWLVNTQKNPQDKSGREKHYFPLIGYGAAALRALPMVWRGMKTARTLAPGKLGTWGRIKSILGPSGRFRDTTKLKGGDPSAGFIKGDPTAWAGTRLVPGERLGIWQALKDPKRLGAAIRENPFTAFGAASAVPQATYGGYRGIKAGVKATPDALKRYADMVIPGDQSRWWKDKEAPTGVPLNPNLQGTIKAAKELSKKKTKEFALQQRNDRVEKYLKMMGYDRAKKTAIADALIDASKIVGDRGTLDLKNIGQELINPIIQATSKRLDKPDQIREAVGLMATKAEIEKDLEDPSIKALRLEQLKELRGGFAKDMGDFVLSARGEKVKPKALERVARARAQEHGLDFKVVTDEDIAGAGEGASLETIIQSAVKDDGVYMIGDAIIEVTDGVPKHVA